MEGDSVYFLSVSPLHKGIATPAKEHATVWTEAGQHLGISVTWGRYQDHRH